MLSLIRLLRLTLEVRQERARQIWITLFRRKRKAFNQSLCSRPQASKSSMTRSKLRASYSELTVESPLALLRSGQEMTRISMKGDGVNTSMPTFCLL